VIEPARSEIHGSLHHSERLPEAQLAAQARADFTMRGARFDGVYDEGEKVATPLRGPS